MAIDLFGKKTICVISLRAPVAVQKANGTQGVALLLTSEDVAVGAHGIDLVGPRTALFTEPGNREVERDLEPKARIVIPYANLAGWVVVEDTDDGTEGDSKR
jgi:hypothetical protein